MEKRIVQREGILQMGDLIAGINSFFWGLVMQNPWFILALILVFVIVGKEKWERRKG